MVRPFTSLDHGNEVVTITVGPEDDSSRTFSVHKNLICKHSSFFRKAFTNSCKEGNDGHINLPDDCPESFELLYEWLYSRQVKAADFYTNGLTSPAPSGCLSTSRQIVCSSKQSNPSPLVVLERSSNDKIQVIPNARFIEDLFVHGSPHNILEAYTNQIDS
jgi:hypothetical protein